MIQTEGRTEDDSFTNERMECKTFAGSRLSFIIRIDCAGPSVWNLSISIRQGRKSTLKHTEAESKRDGVDFILYSLREPAVYQI